MSKFKYYYVDNKDVLKIDKYINDLATQIINNDLSENDENILLKNPNYIDYHFGLGLHIRNNYIYNKSNSFAYEPDEMSEDIFNTILILLKANKNKNWLYFYDLKGKIKEKTKLNKESILQTHGMMVRCVLNNNKIIEGFCDIYPNKNQSKIGDYIILEQWKNYDYRKNQLIGDDATKYNKIKTKVNIKDIIQMEAILWSNPRWGGILLNKFEFLEEYSLKDNIKNIPNFLKDKRLNQ